VILTVETTNTSDMFPRIIEMNRYRFVPLLIVSLSAIAAAAHAQTHHHAKSVGRNAPKVTLAFVTNNPSDYWTLCRKGTEAAAKELGNVSVQFVMPADGTVATQEQDVDDLLAKNVQGIAISPVDPTNETPYLNSVAPKTNLITSDSDAPASRRLCFIGTDNHAAGLQAGRLMRRTLPHGGQIMLFVGKRDAQNAREREKGIRDALRGSNLHILAVREDDADHARAMSNVLDTLTHYPHIAGLVGIWSYNGPAILNAVRSMHKTNQVKIVCFDDESATLEGVRSGVIYATITSQPYQFGYQSVKLLVALAEGNKRVIPRNKRIIVPVLTLTKANIKAFERTRATRLAEN
jgi:ribose transport system substrate-binding protein